MKVLRPNAMTPAMLVSTNATEAYATWASGTTYSVGATVVYAQSIYESLQASNTNKQPDTQPTWWTRIGPSNQWAMFDDSISTATNRTSPLTVTVATGMIDALAFVGVDAELVSVTVRDGSGGPIVYEAEKSVTGETVTDWYEYYFSDPTVRQSMAVFTEIPPYASSHVTVSVSGGGDVSLGLLTFGRLSSVGESSYGMRAGIQDYSRVDIDEFGTTTYTRRGYAKTLQDTVLVERAQFTRVHRMLSDLRATPCLWMASDLPEHAEQAVIFGSVADWYGVVEGPVHCIYSLEIRGHI